MVLPASNFLSPLELVWKLANEDLFPKTHAFLLTAPKMKILDNPKDALKNKQKPEY